MNVNPLIGGIKLPALTRQHIRIVVKAMKERGVTTAVNRTLAALRRALTWAVNEDMLVSNPAQNLVTEVEEKPKDRALSVAEVNAFWAGLDNADTSMGLKSRLALKLILVTGQRPGEVCGAACSEVDLAAKLWTIPSNRAKNKRLHVVPLSDLAVDLFKQALKLSVNDKSDFIFASRPRQGLGLGLTVPMQAHALSHSMRGALEGLGLVDNSASPHDLRRTCASHMARLGFTDSIVSKVLNHSLEQRRSITARVYVQYDYLNEKKLALDAWASELKCIVSSQSAASNVVDPPLAIASIDKAVVDRAIYEAQQVGLLTRLMNEKNARRRASAMEKLSGQFRQYVKSPKSGARMKSLSARYNGQHLEGDGRRYQKLYKASHPKSSNK